MKKRRRNLGFMALAAGLVSLTACNDVVIQVTDVPANTPYGASIYIAGNFNFWDPGDNSYQLDLTNDSIYSITLPRLLGTIEYKFTRGDWSTVEKNKCGIDIGNHSLNSRNTDTIVHSVLSWADLEPINCDSVTIVITNIPENTPEDDPLRVAGNFNAWNPGTDSTYEIKQDPVTRELKVTIPIEPGRKLEEVHYKIVRGDSLNSEANEFGWPIEKRKLNLTKTGVSYAEVEAWEDLEVKRLNSVTIILDEIPDNTPTNDNIYLVGNFNHWVPDDFNYIFEKNKEGKYSITIPRRDYGLSFKVTRGSWHTEAANRYGEKLNNTDYNYDEIDTVLFKIVNWNDMPVMQLNKFTVIIDRIPENTPENSSIYMATNFNDWQPGVEEYRFEQDSSGRYVLDLTTNERGISFKITRGDWPSEAADKRGRKWSNYDYWFPTGNDTVFLEIDNWADLETVN